MGFRMDKWTAGIVGLCLVILVSGYEEESWERSICDNDTEKVAKIGHVFKNFTQCLLDDIFVSADKMKPMDCDKLKSLYECLQNYIESNQECLPGTLSNWNKTLQAIDSTRQELCKDDDNKMIDDFYKESGIECFQHEDVKKCGLSLSIRLLNPEEDLNTFLLKIENGLCSNISEVNSCVVEKMKDESVCKSPNAVNIFIKMNQVIANVTGCLAEKGSANDFMVSSTLMWIVAISVTGLVTLSPS